jgi:hypothetical protein
MIWLSPWPRGVFWCAALSLLAALGCGKSGRELAPVTGRVTLDGQPMPGARIRFEPEANGGSPSYGTTDQEGWYELGYKRGVEGALIGWHTVRIEPGAEPAGPDGKTSTRPKPLPSRYNTQSELRREIKDEENQIDFELTSENK